MKLSHFALFALSLITLIGHAADEKLPAGLESVSSSIIEINNLTDAAVAFLNTPEIKERTSVRLEFKSEMKAADIARIDEIAWAKNLYFFKLDVPVDVAHLRACTGLEYVAFAGCEVKNLEMLSSFPALRSVDIGDCPTVKDLNWLKGLNALTEVKMYRMSQITDFTPLTELPKLETVKVGSSMTATEEALAPLGKIATLKRLEIDYYTGTTLTPFAGCKALEFLGMDDAKALTDISAVAQMPALNYLILNSSKVTDLSPLANSAALAKVKLESTPVVDLSPLANLPKLDTLDLSKSAVADVSPLAALQKLAYLELDGTKVTDISTLAGAESLRSVKVPKEVTDEQKAALKAALPKLSIR